VERYYGGHASLAVMTELPESAWQVWKFSKTPRGFWPRLGKLFVAGDPVAESVVRLYYSQVTQSLGIQNKSDWADVVHRQPWMGRFQHLGGLDVILSLLFDPQPQITCPQI